MRKILIALLCLGLVGCGVKNKKGQENKMTEEEISQSIEQMMDSLLKPDKEKVVLLSIKYGIEESKVNNILIEYFGRQDTIKIALKELVTGESAEKQSDTEESISETIEKISYKYDIPKEKIGALIIDYKAMESPEKE